MRPSKLMMRRGRRIAESNLSWSKAAAAFPKRALPPHRPLPPDPAAPTRPKQETGVIGFRGPHPLRRERTQVALFNLFTLRHRRQDFLGCGDALFHDLEIETLVRGMQ